MALVFCLFVLLSDVVVSLAYYAYSASSGVLRQKKAPSWAGLNKIDGAEEARWGGILLVTISLTLMRIFMLLLGAHGLNI